MSARYSVTFRKTAGSNRGLDFSRPVLRVNVREPFATEVYPGVYAEAGPVRLDVQYRALHRKYRDDSALNNGLRVDPYNPAKWRLALSTASRGGGGAGARRPGVGLSDAAAALYPFELAATHDVSAVAPGLYFSEVAGPGGGGGETAKVVIVR